MAMEPVALIQTTEDELQPLEKALCLAEWDAATEGSEAHERALVAASLAHDALLAEPERHAALADAADDELAPLDRRRLALLRAATTERRRPRELAERIITLEASLQTLFSSHRGTIGGRPVDAEEIDEILRVSTDRGLRREAWEASKQIGAVASPDVRELARLRNEAARRLGFRDHFAMSLSLSELDEGWLLGLLDALDERVSASWRTAKDEIDREQRMLLGLGDGGPLQAWDYADPFFQDAPAPPGDPLAALLAAQDPLVPCRAYFAALGDDVEDVLERSDLYPREAKHQSAFCIQIDRGRDVRVLANVTPGARWTATMLHELGHASYDMALDPDLPWLLRTQSHLLTTEAIAMLHGRRLRDPVFLRRFAGLGDQADDPVHLRVARRDLHVFVPWVQVMTRFERALYADPDADLGDVWWGLVERHQLVGRPAGARDHDWAAKSHLALSPVYYHNYLLGELTASQLEWALARETGSASPAGAPAAAGAFLRERFMRPGASLRWDELIEAATGAPLSPDHAAAFLTAGDGP